MDPGPAKHFKFKVCMLGNSAVGKTSLIRRYVYDEFRDEYLSTIGTKITKRVISLKKGNQKFKVTLMIWDIEGDFTKIVDTTDDFRNWIPENFYSKTEGVLLVCDLTREETFKFIPFWYDNLAAELGRDPPCILLGNKSDLKHDRDITQEEIDREIDVYDFPYYETSAKKGTNVNEAFKKLAKMIMKEMDQRRE